ncbi:hypothetical protein [Desulfosarcina sp.]|uniref:hypothetical protein n=1 Tax=Desulfosarcina sp. TaxID=2027861 RepID=UPI0035622A30
MRHFSAALVLCLLISLSVSQVFSQSLEPADQAATDKKKDSDGYLRWASVTFDLSAGYRTDKLNWHIAGNLQGTNPNVRSELTWSGLRIYQLKLANRTVIMDRFYLRGYLDYGMVISGNNQDSDYNGDDRTQTFSRSSNGVDGNDVWDGSIGVGPRFSFFASAMVVCPMIGYAVSEQDLNIVDGYQAFSAPPLTTPTGPIAGLDSRFQTRWRGPWLGVDLFFSIPGAEAPFTKVGVIFTGEYHWVNYDAEANWNLRSDYAHPVSFYQEADGSGVKAGTTILFEIRDRWSIHAGMNVKEMTTDAGLDRTYYADGRTGETRLNEVRWRSFTFEAGVSCRF